MKIINTKSEEAKNYSFHILRHTITGDVKISWYEFECPVCKKSFTVEQLEEINDIKEEMHERINKFNDELGE